MRSACPTFLTDPHVNRREFLRAGALSLFGLGLPQLLRGPIGTERSRGVRRRASSCSCGAGRPSRTPGT